ncbi:hypothetical protein BRC81_08220 [Halobacteriales archaeon QS_1_68_20]|nr:MAG: hypothetical protein BRC81_08220 [Halobacteriales archaeon QS_1_68_20]
MSRAEQQHHGGQGGGTLDAFDLKRGALYGAIAWVVGLVITAVLAWVEFRDGVENAEDLGGSGGLGTEEIPSVVDFLGWLFYNAHFVDVGFEISIMGMGGGVWMNFVTGSVNLTGMLAEQSGQAGEMQTGLDSLITTIPTPVWLLVPVVLLFGAGYLVARKNEVAGTTDGAKAGASVVVGYAVLSIGGTYLFAWTLPTGEEFGMSLSIAPQFVMAVGLMGLAYPAVLGGVGGALAARSTDQPSSPQTTPTRQQPGHQQQYGQQPQQAPQGQQARSAGQRAGAGGAQQAGQGRQQSPQGGHQQPQRGNQQPTGGQQRQGERRQGGQQSSGRQQQSGAGHQHSQDGTRQQRTGESPRGERRSQSDQRDSPSGQRPADAGDDGTNRESGTDPAGRDAEGDDDADRGDGTERAGR